MNYKTQPPWEFLLSASHNSLQSYELSRLNHANNLRKEMSHLLDCWLEENANALLARWLLQQRERSLQNPDTPGAAEGHSKNGHTASDNFLTDQVASPPIKRGGS